MERIGNVGPFIIEATESGEVFFTIATTDYIRDCWPKAWKAWEDWRVSVTRSVLVKFFVRSTEHANVLMCEGTFGSTEFSWVWVSEKNQWKFISSSDKAQLNSVPKLNVHELLIYGQSL